MDYLDCLDVIGNLLGIFGSITATLAWQAAKKAEAKLVAEKARLSEEIITSFICKGVEFPLDIKLQRDDFIRPEVQALVGNIPRNQSGHYKVAYFATPEFYRECNKIYNGTGKKFVIPLTEEELYQFRLK